MPKWLVVIASLAIAALCVVGLIVVIGVGMHLWYDHQIDDRIRDIQRQQLLQIQQQPPPAPVK